MRGVLESTPNLSIREARPRANAPQQVGAFQVRVGRSWHGHARCGQPTGLCATGSESGARGVQGMATEVVLGPNDDIKGVRTFFGVTFRCASLVLTTGTFMNGRIWCGRQSMAAGRAGEAPSLGLTENLVALGFEADRLKTGTPARVDTRRRAQSPAPASPAGQS